LDHPEIKAYIEHLWKFMMLDGPEAFRRWEADEPSLVVTGLGWEYPRGFEDYLREHAVPAGEFRWALENTAEVVYGSLYGAADNPGSRRHLAELADLVAPLEVPWPDIRRFAESRWADRGGWGRVLSADELASWRTP
jgi:hypothetical protein